MLSVSFLALFKTHKLKIFLNSENFFFQFYLNDLTTTPKPFFYN